MKLKSSQENARKNAYISYICQHIPPPPPLPPPLQAFPLSPPTWVSGPPTPLHIPTPGRYTAGTARGSHSPPDSAPPNAPMSPEVPSRLQCSEMLLSPACTRSAHTLINTTLTHACTQGSHLNNQPECSRPGTLSLHAPIPFLYPCRAQFISWFSSVVSTRPTSSTRISSSQYLHSAA